MAELFFLPVQIRYVCSLESEMRHILNLIFKYMFRLALKHTVDLSLVSL